MSTTIDEKVVSLKFNNQQFEEGVKTSMNTLEKLKTKLKEKLTINDSLEGLQNINKEIKSVDVAPLTEGIQSVKLQFSALEVVGVTVISRITNSILDCVRKLGQNTIGQAITGGKNRALNIANAKFQIEGLGIEYEKIYNQINNAVSGTAYGFDSAAKAASQLAASNVAIGNSIDIFTNKSKTATKTLDSMEIALSAISGVAAMTNSDYDSIADIFTTVAGNGRLMTDQLNRLSARGLNAAAQLGEVLGKTEAEIREMTTQGKINFEMFSEAMYTAFYEHAKDADNTFNGALSNMKASISRIGAEFAAPIYDGMIKPLNALKGMFNQIKKNLSPVITEFTKFAKMASIVSSNIIKGFTKSITTVREIDKIARDRNVIKAIENVGKVVKVVFENVLKILLTIRNAFREVFPKKSFKQFADATKSAGDLAERLRISADALNTFKMVVKGVFSVIKILKITVVSLLRALSPLLPFVGSFLKLGLKLIAVIANIVTALANAIEQVGILKGVLFGITTIVSFVLKSITDISNALVSFVSGDKLIKNANDLTSAFTSLFSGMYAVIKVIGSAIIGIILGIKAGIAGTIGFIGKVFTGIGTVFGRLTQYFNELKSSGVNTFLALINTILYSIATALEKFRDSFKRADEAIKKSSIKESLDRIKNSIKALFTLIKDVVLFIPNKVINTLKTFKHEHQEIIDTITNFVKSINVAKILLAGYATVILLTTIRVSNMIKSFGGLADSLSGFFKSLSSLTDRIAVPTQKTNNVLITLAETMLMIAGALKILSTIPVKDVWEYVKVMAALAGIVTAFEVVMVTIVAIRDAVTAAKFSNKDKDIYLDFTNDMIAMAGAVAILAVALKTLNINKFSDIKAELAAIGVIGAMLSAMAIALSKYAPRMSSGVLFMVSFAFSLKILVGTLEKIKDLKISNLEESIKTLLQVIGLLAAISIVAKGLSPLSAVSILIMAEILSKTSVPLEALKSVDWKAIKDTLTEALSVIGIISAVMFMMANTQGMGKRMIAFTVSLHFFSLAILEIIGIQKLLASLYDGEAGFKEFGKTLVAFALYAGLLTTVAQAFDNIQLNGILSFSVLAVALVGAVDLMINVSKMLGKLWAENPEEVGLGLLGVTVIFSIIAYELGSVSKSISQINFSGLVGLLVLTASVVAEAMLISQFNLWEIGKGLAGVLPILGGITKILSALSNFKKFDKNSIDVMKGMITSVMTGLVFIIGEMAYIAKNANIGQIIITSTSLYWVLQSLTKVIQEVGRLKVDQNIANTLKQLTFVIVTLGGTLVALASIPTVTNSTVIVSTLAICGMLKEFASVLKSMSGIKISRTLIQPLKALGYIITAIGVILGILSKIPLNNNETILVSAISLMGSLYGFIKALDMLSKVKKPKPEVLEAMKLLMKPLIAVLAGIFLINSTGYGTDNVKAMAGISVTLLAFAQTIKILAGIKINDAKTVKKVISLMLISATSMTALLFGLNEIAKHTGDMSGVSQALVSISATLLGFAATLYLLSKIQIDSNQTTNIFKLFEGGAIMIVAIGYSMAMMGTIPWESIKSSLIAVGGVLTIFTGLIYAIKALKFEGKDIKNTLSMLAVTAVGLLGLGLSLAMLNNLIDWSNYQAMLISIGSIIATFMGVLVGLKYFKIDKQIGSMFAMMMAVSFDLAALAGAFELLAKVPWANLEGCDKYLETVMGFLIGLVAVCKIGGGAGLGMTAVVILALAGALVAFGYAAEKAGNALYDITFFFNLMSITIDDVIDKLRQLKPMVTEIGSLAAQGLLEGVENNLYFATLAGDRLGAAFLTGLRNKLDIHSPSRETRQVGVYGGQGLVNGSNEMIPKAEEAGINLGGAYAEGMAETVKQVPETAAKAMDITLETVNGPTALNNFSQAGENIGSEFGKSYAETITEDMAGGTYTAMDTTNTITEEGMKQMLSTVATAAQDIGGSLIDGILAGAGALAAKAMNNKFGRGILNMFGLDVDENTLNTAASLAADDAIKAFTDSINKGQKYLQQIDINELVGGVTDKFDLSSLFETEEGENPIEKITEGLGESLSGLTSGLGGTSGSLGKISTDFEEAEDATDEFGDSLTNLYQTIQNGMSIFTKFDKTVTQTTEDLLNNMRSNITGTTEWTNGLLVLAQRGLSKEFLEKLSEMGQDSYEIINSLLKADADQLAEANKLFGESLELPERSVVQIQASYALAGDETSKAFLEGLGYNMDDIRAMAENMSKSVTETIKPVPNEIKDMFKSLYDSIKGGMSIFDEFSASTEMNADDVLENMESQLNGIKRWSENLRILAKRGISQGLLEELTALGPAGYEKVSAFTEMTNSELKKANKLYAKSLELPQKTTGEVMSSYAIAGNEAASEFLESLGAKASDFKTAGEMVSKGFTEGIFGTEDEAGNAAEDLGNNVLVSLQNALAIHSPSEKTKEFGRFLIEGLNIGIDDNKESVMSKMIVVGEYVVDGLSKGISKSLPKAIGSIRDLTSQIVRTAREELGIHSPSVEFKNIAEFMILGLTTGIREYSSTVEDETQTLGQKAVSAMSKAISNISDLVEEDLDTSPTIRPVIDLSEVDSGLKGLDAIVSRKRAANITAGINYNKSYNERMNNSRMNEQADYANALLAAVSAAGDTKTPVDVHVHLDGDAKGIFKLVRVESDNWKRSTGNDVL